MKRRRDPDREEIHRNDPRMSPAERRPIEMRVYRWRKAYLSGVAGAICDEIVRTRPVPPQLAGVIFGGMDHQLRDVA